MHNTIRIASNDKLNFPLVVTLNFKHQLSYTDCIKSTTHQTPSSSMIDIEDKTAMIHPIPIKLRIN